MATGPMTRLLDSLGRAALPEGDRATDAQLLDAFVRRREEAAFAALVRRHGPLVWGVCRRLLANPADAEDAFQATFLVLVRKAGSVVPREMVANWLYGVACNVCRKARAEAGRRRARERQVATMPEPEAVEPDPWPELEPLLDRELARLPDRYRAAVVLCDLEGKTRREAARELGIPEGTLSSRLSTARAMLAKRLAPHGLAVSGGALGAALSRGAASAGVPPAVVSTTIRAAGLVAAGKAAAGVLPAKVAALTEGVLKTMLLNKLKATVAVGLVLGLMGTGVAALTCLAAGRDGPSGGEERVKPPPAAGQKDGGIPPATSAGLGPTTDHYEPALLGRWAVAKVQVGGPGARDEEPVTEVEVTAETITFEYKGRADSMRYYVDRSKAPKEIDLTPTAARKGVYKGIYRVDGDELRIAFTEDPAPTAARPADFEAEGKRAGYRLYTLKRRADTEWGEAVGGVQAGLGFRPGEHRAYRHYETATLVVRVRNVGKEKVRLQHPARFFLETPPAVTDTGGKPVVVGAFAEPAGGKEQTGRDVAPGEEVEIATVPIELRPPAEQFGINGVRPGGVRPKHPPLYGTGKFVFRYERLAPAGTDNVMGKLSTGKLGLTVRAAADPAGAREVTDEELIQGRWFVFGFRRNGPLAPDEAGVHEVHVTGDKRVVFRSDQKDRGEAFGYVLFPTKSPKEINLIGNDVRGVSPVYKGIYRVEGDELRIAFTRDEDAGAARPTKFDTERPGERLYTLKRPTPPDEKGRHFGPVIEREVTSGVDQKTSFLDLDTGLHVDPNPAPPGTTPTGFAPAPATADLVTSVTLSDTRARVGLKLVAVAAPDAKFESATPAEVAAAVGDPKQQPKDRQQLGGKDRTYYFRTSEGNSGVLQIVPVEGDANVIKVRYKLILTEVKAEPPKPGPEAERLEGRWSVSKVRATGPQALDVRSAREVRLANGTLTILYQQRTESLRYKFDPSKSPPEIDLIPTDPAAVVRNEVYRGIYKLAGDELVICFTKNQAAGAARPSKFDGAERGEWVYTLKRRNPPDAEGRYFGAVWEREVTSGGDKPTNGLDLDSGLHVGRGGAGADVADSLLLSDTRARAGRNLVAVPVPDEKFESATPAEVTAGWPRPSRTPRAGASSAGRTGRTTSGPARAAPASSRSSRRNGDPTPPRSDTSSSTPRRRGRSDGPTGAIGKPDRRLLWPGSVRHEDLRSADAVGGRGGAGRG